MTKAEKEQAATAANFPAGARFKYDVELPFGKKVKRYVGAGAALDYAKGRPWNSYNIFEVVLLGKEILYRARLATVKSGVATKDFEVITDTRGARN